MKGQKGKWDISIRATYICSDQMEKKLLMSILKILIKNQIA